MDSSPCSKCEVFWGLISLILDCGVSTSKVSQSSDGTYDDVVLCVTNLTSGGETLALEIESTVIIL